jgi:hypothetical protein
MRVVNDNNVLQTIINTGFKDLPVAEGVPKPYEISSTTTKQGVVYNMSVSGFLKNLSSSALLELRKMKNLDFVLKMTLLNNETFLAAEPDFPADFDFSIEGGDFGMNKGRVKFRFKGKSPNIMCKIQ